MGKWMEGVWVRGPPLESLIPGIVKPLGRDCFAIPNPVDANTQYWLIWQLVLSTSCQTPLLTQTPKGPTGLVKSLILLRWVRGSSFEGGLTRVSKIKDFISVEGYTYPFIMLRLKLFLTNLRKVIILKDIRKR
jgi:hypothetical protein